MKMRIRGNILSNVAGLFYNCVTKGYYSSNFINKCARRTMSRYSASSIVPASDSFSFNEFDSIGFDLDNTLCHYNISNVVPLEYDILSRFLIREKGYDPKYLSRPLSEGLDFIQKGLVLSCKKGHILRVGADGYIHKGHHGSNTPLTESDIIKHYGPERQWDIAKEFNKDMLIAWNGPLSFEIRTILDYFDLPASLCFARCVDTIDDKNGGPKGSYDIWPDILDGLMYMFNRENYELNTGEFFPEVKVNTEKYYRKCNKDVISWIKSLKKQNKITYLITGSNVDYANLTARYCIGDNWRELFDIVIYYARKPGFFTGERPFVSVKDMHEAEKVVLPEDLQRDCAYSQGNWKGLHNFVKKTTGKPCPKILYFGDNIIQDIYTPAAHKKCETIAVVEEMSAEGMFDVESAHPDASFLTSQIWGSFFCVEDPYESSMWDNVIRRHAKLCIPSLEYIAKLPITHQFKAFNNEEQTATGFYPAAPSSLEF